MMDHLFCKYGDDMIPYMDHDLDKAVNMKLILSVFEQLSGLKINFHKSEPFTVSGRLRRMSLRAAFRLWFGLIPFKYLGIPIHSSQTS